MKTLFERMAEAAQIVSLDGSGPCPECGGDGWTAKVEQRCCGGSDWECGGRGCTGPREDWVQEQCEYCLGSGQIAEGHAPNLSPPSPTES